MSGPRAWLGLAALLALAAGASAADELVTRDGQVIETRGPWEVRGKLLVFELADGTLASLRLDEADLEASERRVRERERRAREARERQSALAPEPPEAVVVLTDRDVAHAADSGASPETEVGVDGASAASVESTGEGGDAASDGAATGEDDAAAAAADSTGRGVQVVQWSQESGGETGFEVRGVIQNLGSSFATSLKVNALFYDGEGRLVAAREVEFPEGPLSPGARRDFSVSLPFSLLFEEIKFQVVGRGFRSVGQSVRAERPADDAEPIAVEPQIP